MAIAISLRPARAGFHLFAPERPPGMVRFLA
jgi:hypothetical protein